MKIFRIFLALCLTTLINFSFAQSGPPAPSNGIWSIIDTNYKVGKSTQGYTTAKLTLKNTTISKITGTQFRVFFDKNAFSTASVSLIGNPPNLVMDYVVDQTNGFITITLVYTGSSALYTIPDGETFEITFTHITPISSFLNLGQISNLTWVGTQTFQTVAAEQPGNDITLSTHNYGGNFIRPELKFHGKFTNVTGTPSKTLTLAFNKKPKSGGSWTTVSTYTTDSQGKFNIQQTIDTSYYDVRIEVRGDTMFVGNVITVADAQRINQTVLGTYTPQAWDFYSQDVNGDGNISISDAYGVFGRISGRFNTWPNNVPEIKFFTVPQYSTISSNPNTNMTQSVVGVTNFTYDILPNQPDSVEFYVLVPGDANNTGYHMARVTPIKITNPAKAPYYIIDEMVEYDSQLGSIEIKLPSTISVQSGNLVEVPVKLVTGDYKLGAIQMGLKYDSELLEFLELNNSTKAMKWMTYINPKSGRVEWGGFDQTKNQNLFQDGETVFTVNFVAKTPQDSWENSPLYTTRKFVGSETAGDLNVTASNGMLEIARIAPTVHLIENQILVFPNPTTGEVVIQFTNPIDGEVKLYFVDQTGKEVYVVLEKYLPKGTFSYTANLSDLNNGIYYTTLKTQINIISNKTILKK